MKTENSKYKYQTQKHQIHKNVINLWQRLNLRNSSGGVAIQNVFITR